MDISVIIPSYCSEASLPATLKALHEQVDAPQFEVIVVDCSPDERVLKICEPYPQVRMRRELSRFNPGIGRNLGAEWAKGELLVFLDADVILAPRALQAAQRFYQAGHRVFGGALELNEAAASDAASYLEHLFFNHESQKGRPSCERSNLSSALMVVEREVFLKDGGFLDIPRMQDTEMTERLRRAGQVLSFCPEVLAYQTQDSPLPKVLRKIYINGQNLFFIRYQNKALLQRVMFGALLPAITTAKMTRIVARHLRYQEPRLKIKTLQLSPLLSLSGGVWMMGLYRSLIWGGEISTRRD